MKQMIRMILQKPYIFTVMAILAALFGAVSLFIVTVISVVSATHPLSQ